MNAILVVCEGNICRSPMAQGLLAASLPNCQVNSAGLGALVGMPADEMAVRLMHSRSVDITKHRATQLTRDMCMRSEIVLVMDVEQKQRIEKMYPASRGRIFRIGEYSKRDIPDPYRKGERAFRDALALIDEGTRDWLQRIQKV